LLQHSEIGRLFIRDLVTGEDENENEDANFIDEDDTDTEYGLPVWRRRRKRERPDPNRFPKVPSDEGTELMDSGIFGTNEVRTIDTSMGDGTIRKKKKLARRILDRELAVGGDARQKVNQRLMAQVQLLESP
jgi:WD repeat-containing protein 23